MNDIEQVLRHKGVRSTPIRVGILSLLTQSNRAYTHADLERAFDHALDRVSLYRCLLTLTDAGLVHKHIDTKGLCWYFVAPVNRSADAAVPVDAVPMDHPAGTGPDDYPHFKCNQCETVVSLPKLPEEYMARIRQYQLDNLRLLGEGTCDDCRHRSEDHTHQLMT